MILSGKPPVSDGPICRYEAEFTVITTLFCNKMMTHGKSFLYGLSGIVQGRLGWAGEEMKEFCPQIESIITKADWLRDQEFDTIHYVMRFGSEKLDRIECTKRRRYQELEVASVESMEALHRVFLHRPLLRALLATEVKRVMHYLTEKYQLPRLPDLDTHLDQQIEQAQNIQGCMAARNEPANAPVVEQARQ